jgi:predicted enzyme related to lactoylglutathione lyase
MKEQPHALANGAISYLFILVSDFQRMVTFYRDVLGFELFHLEPDHCAFLAFRKSRKPAIALYAGRQSNLKTVANWFLVIDVQDIDATAAQLRSAGINTGEVKNVPYGRAVQFTDPEGNLLEAHQSS